MTEERITLEELHNLYKEGLGIEGAQSIIKDAIIEAGLNEEKEYIKEEALRICGALGKKGGFVKIIANLFAARIGIRIDIQTLVRLFQESIGVEAAEKLIYEGIKNTHLPIKTSYTEEEFEKICKALKKKGGFIKTIATIASTTAFSDFYYGEELVRERREREDLARLRNILEQKVEERTRQLRDMEVQMLQSAKMAAVGQLAAGIAHEINNPLGGILGYAQFMLSKLEKPDFNIEDFKTCGEYIRHIERESQRCKHIVESLLVFSRKSSEAFEPVDVKSVVETTLSLLRHSLELQNIKLNLEPAPNLPLIVGNANQLQQVFTNIIINARQAMPQGGELNICFATKQEGTKRYLEVSFRDTGCGVSKENLGKVFEPFFTTKQDWKAVGLGLSVSYQIIQEHKGMIRAESELGKGATFIISLPVE